MHAYILLHNYCVCSSHHAVQLKNKINKFQNKEIRLSDVCRKIKQGR